MADPPKDEPGDGGFELVFGSRGVEEVELASIRSEK
jgi:hypothetical protein